MNRFLKLTALGGVVVAVLIAMILRTGLASATSESSCGGWNVVSSPSPSSAFNSLHGIWEAMERRRSSYRHEWH